MKKSIIKSLKPDTLRQIQELHEPSNLGTILFVFYACFMYFGIAFLIGVVVTSTTHLLIKLVVIIPLYLLCISGLRLMGNLGHDGTHFCLHKRKFISVMIGCFFSSSVIGFTEMGFAVSHWYHHRYTNEVADPDVVHYRKFPRSEGLLRRLILAFPSRLGNYYLNTIKLALGLELPYACKLALKEQEIRLLSIFNLIFSLLWFFTFSGVTIWNPLAGFFAIWLPNSIALFANSFTVFVQHSDTEKESLYNSRSLVSPINTILYYGGNFHLEHHLYPAIPMYRLPLVHKILKESGVYDNGVRLDSSSFAEMRHAFNDYPAGT